MKPSTEETLHYEIEKTTEGINSHNVTDASDENRFFSGSFYLIGLYIKDVKRNKALSAQEEHELAVRIQDGDKEARNKIIQSSLLPVAIIAHQFAGCGLPLEDLIQEGSVGLLKAARKFSVSKNYRFMTYAAWWVRREIVHAIKTKTAVVAVPAHIHGKVGMVQHTIREWEAAHGETPTHEDIVKETGFSFKKIENLLNITKSVVYLDDPVSKDDNFTLGDTIADNRGENNTIEFLETEHRNTMVSSWINRLKEKERTVIHLRYGFEDDEPMTLEAIGHKMGISRERVRQIEQQAYSKMRLWAGTGQFRRNKKRG